jgi:S1-C subfamily serine protease
MPARSRVLLVVLVTGLLLSASAFAEGTAPDPDAVHCVVCGAANPAGSKFCQADGAPIPEYVPARQPASFVRSADTLMDEEIQQTLDRVAASVVRIRARTTTTYKYPTTWFKDREAEYYGRAMIGKIETSDTDQRFAGSGFAIGEDGEIVTNAHVASPEGMKAALTVETREGKSVEATVVGVDAASDLALLRVPPGTLPPLEWGDSQAVRVGQQVWAVGNPLDIGLSFARGTMSGISATRVGLNQVEAFLHSDAHTTHGNSGGPLVDVTGRVLGACDMGFDEERGQGYTIPSRMARLVVDRLRKGTYTRGFVGLHVKPVDGEAISLYNLVRRDGSVVQYVLPDTPAARADLRPGDVVYGINGRATASTYVLQESISSVGAGAPIKLQVDRQGKALEVALTTTTRPAAPHSEPLQDMQDYLRLYFEEDPKAHTVTIRDPNRSRRAPGLYEGAIVKSVVPGQDWPEEPITLNYYKTRAKPVRVSTLDDLRTAFARSHVGGKVAATFEVIYVNGAFGMMEPICSVSFDEVWPIFI